MPRSSVSSRQTEHRIVALAAGFCVLGVHHIEITYFSGVAKSESRNLRRRLVVYVLTAGFVGAVYALYRIYLVKSPWYGPTFAPPQHYITGPLSRDQGTTT